MDRPFIATQEWCEKHLNVSNPGNQGAWDWALLADIAVVTTAHPYTIQENVRTLLAALSEDEILALEEDFDD